MTLHAAFLARAAEMPDATAVVERGQSVTYCVLADRVLRRACALRTAGLRDGDRVALLTPKTTPAVEAIYAVLCAGGIYVPLDPQSPPARLAKILRSSEPAFAWVTPELAGKLTDAGMPQSRLLRIDEGPSAAPLDEIAAPADDAVAHLLYTSGSTGDPKGVAITHHNVQSFLAWAVPHFRLGPGERRSCHPPLHFDLSTLDLHGTLSAGGELHLVPADALLHAGQLAEFIRTHRLTQWFSVPSALVWLHRFDAVRAGDFPELRELSWCGEVLPTPTLQWLMQRLPHARFTNLYGPTEATIASTYHELTEAPRDPAAAIPIGIPCPREQAWIVDDELRELPADGTGELCLGGDGLSPGYWRDPERTAQAFPTWTDARGEVHRIYRTGDLARRDAAGLLWFAGRRDAQIKSRGYRIELGEIEAALHAQDAVAEAAVVALPTSGFEGMAICCAYRSRPGEELPPAKLRAALAQRLPPWMLPGHWLPLTELPANQNGKVDRVRLRELFRPRVPPPTA